MPCNLTIDEATKYINKNTYDDVLWNLLCSFPSVIVSDLYLLSANFWFFQLVFYN